MAAGEAFLSLPSTVGLLILLCHAAATFYLVGLVWFVQRVHYPLFAGVGPAGFAAYERAHTSRTTPVVAPPMLIEAKTGLLLLLFPAPGLPPWPLWLGLALIAAIWLSTFALQVPRHRDLERGFDAGAHRSLVGTNWIRTALWSLRGALVLGLLFQTATRAPA